MCGIFGYIGEKKTSAQIVLAGLKALEYRGYDSWGVAVGEATGITVKKKVGKIENQTVDELPDTTFAFGHTRWATHGGVTKKNAHPHLDCSKHLGLIHNGIIENYDVLRAKLDPAQHTFLSETDTEVAVHLIEEEYDKRRKAMDATSVEECTKALIEAVRTSFRQFSGLNAMIVMDTRTSTFVAVKNGSPLVIGKGNRENFLASDAHALLPYTRSVYFMEDEDVVVITNKSLDVYALHSGKKKPISFTTLDWKIEEAKKGNFSHFMIKEIHDQPTVIDAIARLHDENFSSLAGKIQSSFGTYLVGCGTAAYACLAGTYLFSTIAKRHVNAAVGSEFGYLVDFLTPKSLVLALSQSGETIDVIDAVKRAKEKGAHICAMVNVLGSTLYRTADDKILLGAGIEKAVLSTKAFTAKLAHLIRIAHIVAGTSSDAQKDLTAAAALMRTLLEEDAIHRIQELVQTMHTHTHMYVIGRGLSYPIALETALKIKEASYIHAEGFAGGELKHGVIALIEENIPCIAFLPNDETYQASLAGVMEMKARGGRIIGISFKNHEVFDEFISVPDIGIASVIPEALIGQLLGYFLAIARGNDPDKPRNLAKSVTVK